MTDTNTYNGYIGDYSRYTSGMEYWNYHNTTLLFSNLR